MSEDILCWFCSVCETLTLLEKALAGECCKKPRHSECPLPLRVPRLTDKA
jgi:hypothetical protein